jgi:hypothetical protein
MHFVYIDDSGDERVRAYSALAIADVDWKDALARVKAYRRTLKKTHGIYITKEFHATDFVGGRGNIASAVIGKKLRCQIFRDTLRMTAGIRGIRLFNAIAPRGQESLIFERLMNRINVNMQKAGSNAVIFHDEGKDYTKLIRRLGIFNPIQSMYGAWGDGDAYRNLPLDHILEDIIFRKSESSYFIQLADFCAFALFRCEHPIAARSKYNVHAAFQELHDICIPQAHLNASRQVASISKAKPAPRCRRENRPGCYPLDILPGLKAPDSCPEAQGSFIPPADPGAGFPTGRSVCRVLPFVSRELFVR